MDLLTRAEAAQYLSLTVRYMAHLAHRRTGPDAIKFGHRTLRYRRTTLDAWLAARSAALG